MSPLREGVSGDTSPYDGIGVKIFKTPYILRLKSEVLGYLNKFNIFTVTYNVSYFIQRLFLSL